MRKIIQLSQFGVGQVSAPVALCDDGSLWVINGDIDAKWHRLPNIPQDDEVKKGSYE